MRALGAAGDDRRSDRLTWTEDNLLSQVSYQGQREGQVGKAGRSVSTNAPRPPAKDALGRLRSSRRSRRKRKDGMAPVGLYGPVPGSRCHAPIRCAVVVPEGHELAIGMERADRLP